MGTISTALQAFTSAAGSAGDTGKELACFVCSDGPTPGPRRYPGAAASGAGASGRRSTRRSGFFNDLGEILALVPEAVREVVGDYWEGVNADMDAEAATGGLNPDGSPDINPYSFGMRDDLAETIAKAAEKTEGTGPLVLVIGTALDSAKVMHDIGRLKPQLDSHRADQDSKGIDVIAEERAKQNPAGSSD